MTARDLELDAAEFALGILSAEERRALETEYANNPIFARAVEDWESGFGSLALAAPAITPPGGLWAKVDAAIDALPDPRLTRVAKADGIWVGIFPGVSIKVLNNNVADGTQTFLLKLAPGARVPAHHHPHPEECFVVEGAMTFGAETFSAGDYIAYPAGVSHTDVFSATGGTILIRGGYA